MPARSATLPAVPPPEILPSLPAPRLPSLTQILVEVYEKRLVLEWYIIALLMWAVASGFKHLHGVATLREWHRRLAPQVPLRDPAPDGYPPLDTPALLLESPHLPAQRFYFLIPVQPTEFCITFVDTTRTDEPHIYRSWHSAALSYGSLFLDDILRLVYQTLLRAAGETEIDVAGGLARVILGFGAELRELAHLRGKKW